MFEMDNLSTWTSNHSNLDFLRQWELGKFNLFYTIIYTNGD